MSFITPKHYFLTIKNKNGFFLYIINHYKFINNHDIIFSLSRLLFVVKAKGVNYGRRNEELSVLRKGNFGSC